MANDFRIKENWDNSVPSYQSKVSNVLNSGKATTAAVNNPFLDKYGGLVNPYLDYQTLLDSSNVSNKAKRFIQQATGLKPTANTVQQTAQQVENIKPLANTDSGTVSFNAGANENNLASLDVTTSLPKLTTDQISKIISKHFSNSSVISPSDASGIYNAQQKSGMSALAILGIGALESGYGTSNIAKQKNNLWGWNATNVNPGGNATSFSQMSQGALEFANKYLKTYYDGYGAKSISQAGTGNNPSGKGYAYNDDGTINSQWATDVGSIMKNFYRTAKGTS